MSDTINLVHILRDRTWAIKRPKESWQNAKKRAVQELLDARTLKVNGRVIDLLELPGPLGGKQARLICPQCKRPALVLVKGLCSTHRWYKGRRSKNMWENTLFWLKKLQFNPRHKHNLKPAKKALEALSRKAKHR